MSKLKIIKQYLLRPIPKGIFHIGYIFAKNDSILHLHKKIFLHSFKGKQNALFNTYAWITWYLFFAWLHIFKVWNRRKEPTFINARISKTVQLRQLFSLAFKYGIQPHSYYQLRLYEYPENEWMNFLFAQELPALHQLFTPKMSNQTKSRLKFKNLFAKQMKEFGVNVIDGLALKKGQIIDKEQLFGDDSLFLKPDAGSGQRDNFTLLSEKGNYRLLGTNTEITTPNQILSFLNQKVKRTSLLAQPLCLNHEKLNPLTTSQDLITIRLVTIIQNKKVNIASALIEIPLQDNRRVYCVEQIDVKTGKVQLSKNNHLHEKMENINFTLLNNFEIPLWEDVCSNAVLAHEQMAEVYSIGWDLAVTSKGVKVIEGNFNWNVVPHQLNRHGLISWFH